MSFVLNDFICNFKLKRALVILSYCVDDCVYVSVWFIDVLFQSLHVVSNLPTYCRFNLWNCDAYRDINYVCEMKRFSEARLLQCIA